MQKEAVEQDAPYVFHTDVQENEVYLTISEAAVGKSPPVLPESLYCGRWHPVKSRSRAIELAIPWGWEELSSGIAICI